MKEPSDLWNSVWGKPEVDPVLLARAIEHELHDEPTKGKPDFRTRILIRDATNALERYWGRERFKSWLNASTVRSTIEAIQREDLGTPGFPSLQDKLMKRTDPETVKEYLREIGTRIKKPERIELGGSIALILTGYLTRATEDLDVVDEVPEIIRTDHALLEELQKRYGLLLTHFQSHYLPLGWEQRLHHAGQFGSLDVYTVDVHDIFLGKLFSARAKDLDDLRAIKPRVSKTDLSTKLAASGMSLLNELTLRSNAEKNWYILFGEALPC
jgi:hypothetical protein